MPYRVSARSREPQSPDVDVNLLRQPWSSRALVISVVYSPFLAWWLVMVEAGSGPRQVSSTAKIAIAAAFALWLVVLMIGRARHQRVVTAAVAKMEQEAEASSSRLRISQESSRTRVGDDVKIEQEHESDPLEQRRRSTSDE